MHRKTNEVAQARRRLSEKQKRMKTALGKLQRQHSLAAGMFVSVRAA